MHSIKQAREGIEISLPTDLLPFLLATSALWFTLPHEDQVEMTQGLEKRSLFGSFLARAEKKMKRCCALWPLSLQTPPNTLFRLNPLFDKPLYVAKCANYDHERELQEELGTNSDASMRELCHRFGISAVPWQQQFLIDVERSPTKQLTEDEKKQLTRNLLATVNEVDYEKFRHPEGSSHIDCDGRYYPLPGTFELPPLLSFWFCNQIDLIEGGKLDRGQTLRLWEEAHSEMLDVERERKICRGHPARLNFKSPYTPSLVTTTGQSTPGFRMMSEIPHMRKIALGTACLSSSPCLVPTPKITGVPFLYGCRVTLKEGLPRAHVMTIYLFGTVHVGLLVETNIGDVLKLLFAQAQPTSKLCPTGAGAGAPILDVFVEYRDNWRRKALRQGKDWQQIATEDAVITQAQQRTGLESQQNPNVFLHAVDIRGDIPLIRNEAETRRVLTERISDHSPDTNERFLILWRDLLASREYIVTFFDELEGPLLRKQQERSGRTEVFNAKFEEALTKFLCYELDVSVKELRTAFSWLRVHIGGNQSREWRQKLLSLSQKMRQWSLSARPLLMDAYALRRAFRVYPKRPRGLTNILLIGGLSHMRNFVAALDLLQKEDAISLCSISIDGEHPIFELTV